MKSLLALSKRFCNDIPNRSISISKRAVIEFAALFLAEVLDEPIPLIDEVAEKLKKVDIGFAGSVYLCS